MDKVRISEIAQELGLTSKEVLTYAHEIDMKAKAANSAVSVEDAEVLMEYIMTGVKPVTTAKKESKKASDKKSPTTEKKAVEKKKEQIKKPPVKQKRPVKKVSKPIKRKLTKEEQEEQNKKMKKILLSVLIIVPIIALIVFGALNFDFVKEKFDATTEYVSNIVSGNKQESTIDTANTIDTTQVISQVEQDSLDKQKKAEEVLQNYTVINGETNESVTPKVENFSDFENVEIIAGSFKSKRNAKKFKNQLNNKGLSAKVLAKTQGLYRVSVGSFSSLEEAAGEIENVHELAPSINVWVLIKK
jgi:translation initiation factor IF-2